MEEPIHSQTSGAEASLSGELQHTGDGRYALSRWRSGIHRALSALPPCLREVVAERWLRRPGSPGPAAEHVVQYLLSAARPEHGERKRTEATVAKGADSFYAKQYRQTLNATMGAFAMTATQALIAAGGSPRGWLWRRHRRTSAAMLDQGVSGAPPLLVLADGTVAAAVLLPRLRRHRERVAVGRWLNRHGPMPETYRELREGEEIRAADRSINARERSSDGAVLEVLDAVLNNGRLALLALHPYDPDAMGLHITLFGTAVLGPERLEREYGLETGSLSAYREAARRMDRTLLFCVGGTEETFTQCSQNLFVKRPAAEASSRPDRAHAWDPRLPLEQLFAHQFEMIQVTVSAGGLPGASPRNGDRGKAAFVGRRRGKVYLLIPYHPGNSVHGHAAKLWSNPYGSMVISDDHRSLRRIVLSGPARFISHARAERDFPSIAAEVSRQAGRDAAPKKPPEYWFLQEIAELVQEREFLPANVLDPCRPTCSISAGGEARHGKKPHYFAAEGLPAYDQALQHRRESEGRPRDPRGGQHRDWLRTVQDALAARNARLAKLAVPEGSNSPGIAPSERQPAEPAPEPRQEPSVTHL